MTAHTFSPEIVDAVLRHMNTDHPGDSLVIARAFADPAAEAAVMIDLDGNGGVWSVSSATGEMTAKIEWASPVTERSGIRREVVALYDAACERLGIPPRPH
ncbi:DUF2470 domain-containing protein [Mycetocola sp. 2940]|uniref:DUF2470 domain-containing protein n=1 Tax=Mycetocola sp. 2940 TaxID=3156452 RepID=UPI00339292CB